MSWKIKGEAGKTLDATLRTLESLRVTSCQVRFEAGGTDSLSWVSVTDNATGAGAIIPDAGQVVELWWDNGSTPVRRFRGHATVPKPGAKSVTVNVAGPQWWMGKIQLTQVQSAAAGADAERTSYQFQGATPTTFLTISQMIAALKIRAIANGVPIGSGGTTATTFEICNVTFANMDCAAALSDLLRWCSDAVWWVDYYATASTTLPTLNVTRRKTGITGSMTDLTYTVGTDTIEQSIAIYPRLDLDVARVELAYVERQAVTGKPMWASQASGATIANSYGRRQMVAISGPEIVQYLPAESFQTVDVQTGAMAGTVAVARDAALGAALTAAGGYYGGIANSFTSYNTSGSTRVPTVHNFPPLTYTYETGTKVYAIPTGKRLVISGTPLPDWAVTQLGGVKVTVSGTWLYTCSTDSDAVRQALIGAGWPGYFWGYAGSTGTANVYAALGSFSFDAMLIDSANNFPTLNTVYKTADFSYASPPAGLAANLLECQAFVPYEGTLSLVADEVDCLNTLGYCVNVANSRTEHATMRAMQRAITYDLMSKRKVIELGTPARTDFGSLVSRIRRDPKDCIVML